MYVMITNHCNMTCEHCGMDKLIKNNKHMSLKTFRNVLQQLPDLYCLTLGGGEPTLNPYLFEILGLALSCCDIVGLITNGSQTEKMRKLMHLRDSLHEENFFLELSLDYYHDPIDPDIDAYFRKHNLIRDNTYKEINNGKCDFGTPGCMCDDMIVLPNGDVKFCACDNAPMLGTINDDIQEIYEKIKEENDIETNCFNNY